MLEVLRQLLLLLPNDNDDDDDDYYWQAVCIACRVHFVNLLAANSSPIIVIIVAVKYVCHHYPWLVFRLSSNVYPSPGPPCSYYVLNMPAACYVYLGHFFCQNASTMQLLNGF